MSDTDPIAADLAAMAAGLEKGQPATDAAGDTAVQITRRAAGSGFTGIARNMSRVGEAIREIASGVAAVGCAVEEARASVAAAAQQPSPQETVVGLASVAARLDTIDGLLAATIERVDRAEQRVASALRCGQPGPLLGRLGAIRELLSAVAQRGAGGSGTPRLPLPGSEVPATRN